MPRPIFRATPNQTARRSPSENLAPFVCTPLDKRTECITYCIQDQGATEMNLSTLSKMTEDEARETLERIVWPNGAVCPHCGCVEGHTKLKGKKHRPGVWK